MTVSRLKNIPGIGVDMVGAAADDAEDPEFLRLENLDTDLRPASLAVELTKAATESDLANSYLPFRGHMSLREAAAAHVGRIAGRVYDPVTQCVSVAGGLNGVLNTLLATVEPGDEVVVCDPGYAGLINRIRLVGGVPYFVRSTPTADGWRTDPAALANAVGPRTAAVLVMSPSMPTGGVLDTTHWDALAAALERTDAWVVYDAAMERIRFDGRAPDHPARHPGLADRTITVGSASKELRMIGWRVGWVVGPLGIMADIGLVGLTNVVSQVGIAQQAVAAVLNAEDSEADVAAATEIWRERCEVVLEQLAEYPCIRPDGGWSLLIDTSQLGLTPAATSGLLFDRAKVAATPMDGWGPSAAGYLRIVFANEPVERLAELRDRFHTALG